MVQALEREAKYELESIMVMQWQAMHMYAHIRPGGSVTNVAELFAGHSDVWKAVACLGFGAQQSLVPQI